MFSKMTNYTGTNTAASARDNAKSPLTALPAELFERVATFLPTKDLAYMRLVSREANHKITHHHISANFTNISILVCDADSIRGAAEILQHPVFGPAVRQISFCMDSIISDWISPIDHYLGIYRHWRVDPNHDDQRKLRAKRQQMRSDGEDVELWTTIWRSLKTHDPGHKFHTIHLTDVRRAARTPVGYAKFEAAGGLCFPTISFHVEDDIKLAFETLANSELAFDTLSMEAGRWGLAMDIQALPLLAALFSRPKHLRLMLWSPDNDLVSAADVGVDMSSFLQSALASADKLETLSLELPGEIWMLADGSSRHKLTWYATAAKSEFQLHALELPPRLRELRLRAGATGPGALADLIATNPHLRRLEVSNSDVFVNGWKPRTGDGDAAVTDGVLRAVVVQRIGNGDVVFRDNIYYLIF